MALTRLFPVLILLASALTVPVAGSAPALGAGTAPALAVGSAPGLVEGTNGDAAEGMNEGTAARAAAGEVLLSRGRPVAASSQEGADVAAGKAVDGAVGTRWSSQFSDAQWLSVDLGTTVSVTRVVLRWEGAYGKAYQIQTSGDGAAWTTVKSVSG